MILDWKYSLEKLSENPQKQSCSLHEHLDKISFEEIREVKNRVNFYLTHLKIIAKKNNSVSTEKQLSFLKKLNGLLDNEICKRRERVPVYITINK
jgi:hypothetical protein